MRIVISHFHLQTGGVTRVIQHACTALGGMGHQVLVVAGEPPQQPLPDPCHFALVPALAYEERRPPVGPEDLADELDRTAREHFGRRPNLWHAHNHSLGKNLAVPGALVALASRGHRLLLQPHDFAEDGRPALYARLLEEASAGDTGRLSALLYPQAPHIHYAVLNNRDRSFLAAAGVPAERLHALPNAVAVSAPPEPHPHAFGERRLWLYPTRAIRRKNLGEFLLWAQLASEADVFAATQAPQNPAEQPRYRHWAALATELELPLDLELGTRVDDFPGLLASAHSLVTTSVAEGFGLAFLEPWLVGRPLAGRDLPEITDDFAAAGVDLRGLYARLDVPLEWIDATRLRKSMATALTNTMGAYGREERAEHLERLWTHLVRDGRIDFGRLDETAQEGIVRRLAANPSERDLLSPRTLHPETSSELIAGNRAVTERHYSIEGYGRHLNAIYDALVSGPTDETLGAGDAGALLDRFLAPERLFLLRT
jgi:glycosyltransferase involved in cell wall biosynthesis